MLTKRSARHVVTATVDGKKPKNFGDCQCINPGAIVYSVYLRRVSRSHPSSGGASTFHCPSLLRFVILIRFKYVKFP